MDSPKLPSPGEGVVGEDGLVTRPWYQYMLGLDRWTRNDVNVVTTESTAGNIYNNRVNVVASTAGVIHTLETPHAGTRTLIIVNIPSTQAGSVTVAASTDVAIGPGGENALVFGTSVSTYEFVELIGTSTSQYHILTQTTNVSVGASS